MTKRDSLLRLLVGGYSWVGSLGRGGGVDHFDYRRDGGLGGRSGATCFWYLQNLKKFS